MCRLNHLIKIKILKYSGELEYKKYDYYQDLDQQISLNRSILI